MSDVTKHRILITFLRRDQPILNDSILQDVHTKQEAEAQKKGCDNREFSDQPRLDTVLVVWLSNRSGSAPAAAVSFFRQRFSSMCSRYSSSCCMGRFFLSFAQSCEPSQDREKHFPSSVSYTVCSAEAFASILPSRTYLHLKKLRRGPGED